MKFHRNTLLSVFTIFLIITVFWDIYLYTLSSHTTFWNYAYNFLISLFFLGGGIVSLIYSPKFGIRSNLGKMFLFFGVGLLSFWAGMVLWIYYTFAWEVEIPYPSFADAAYIFFYIFMAIGTVYLLQLYRNVITKRLVIESIVIIILSCVFIFGFFTKPDLSSDLSWLNKLFNVMYPSGDVIILSIALITLRSGTGKTHPSLYIFVFGLFMMTSADLVFSYRNTLGTYWNGDIADLLYTFAPYFMSIGLFELIDSLLKPSKVSLPNNPTV